MEDKKTADERKALLGRQSATLTVRGFRVESQGDYQVVVVKGEPVNHVLHLILSFFTLGVWLVVWAALVLFGGEKRSVVQVDEFGNVIGGVG